MVASPAEQALPRELEQKRGTLDYAGDVAKCRLGAFVLISVVCAICGKSVGEKT